MFPQYYSSYSNPYYNMFPMPTSMNFPTTTPSSAQGQSQGQSQGQNSDFNVAPGSPTSLGTEYTQGYLKTQIGKRVKIFFLIGTSIVQDRDGILTDVGISYVVLKEPGTNNNVLCDIYAIKFVTIYAS